jgi:hypothetical protein
MNLEGMGRKAMMGEDGGVVMHEEKDEIGAKLESRGARVKFNCWNFGGIRRVWRIRQWSER